MAAHLVHAWVREIDAQLYVWRIPPAPTTPELHDALSAIRVWIRALDEPYGWVTDPRVLRIGTLAQERKIVAEHLRAVEPQSRRFCRGMAIIVTSPVIRGISTAIGWLYTYPFEVTQTASEAEAVAWVRARMRDGEHRAGAQDSTH